MNDNIVNIYNQIAVAATLDRLGVGRDRIVAAFEFLQPPLTRFAEQTINGVRLVRILTKGLVGVACSRAFEYLSTYSGRKAVVLNIDEVSERTTDVENVAWTYDADYGYLADGTLDQIVVGGVRRHDQALRLAIAGVPSDRIVTVQTETEAAERLELTGADAVFNLHSVHNALITGNPVQATLQSRLRAQRGEGAS
jgi:lipid II isoglutaminyl synthase (glutamine-hydrolysing)